MQLVQKYCFYFFTQSALCPITILKTQLGDIWAQSVSTFRVMNFPKGTYHA
jgi:hypothetical protein